MGGDQSDVHLVASAHAIMEAIKKPIMAGVCLACAVLFGCGVNPTNRWTSGGDARTWEDPRNWSLGKVPGSQEVAEITATNQIVVQSVVRLHGLSLSPATSLVCVGTHGEVEVSAWCRFDGANLIAKRGAKITLPGGGYKGPTSPVDTLWWADGTNSRITVAITALSGGTSGAHSIEATDGGTIRIDEVTGVTNGHVAVSVGNPDATHRSIISFSKLGWGAMDCRLNPGGRLEMPALTNLSLGSMRSRGGGHVEWAKLSQADGASFAVSQGAKLKTGRGFQSYTGRTDGHESLFSASGPESALDLGSLTQLKGGRPGAVIIRADKGGVVWLNNVPSLTGGNFTVEAAGTGSAILATNVGAIISTHGNNTLVAATQGKILLANLLIHQRTRLEGVELGTRVVNLDAQSGPTLTGESNQVYEIQEMNSQGAWRTISKVPMTNSHQRLTIDVSTPVKAALFDPHKP